MILALLVPLAEGDRPRGKLVSIDASATGRTMAAVIRQARADRLLAVKVNQSRLRSVTDTKSIKLRRKAAA